MDRNLDILVPPMQTPGPLKEKSVNLAEAYTLFALCISVLVVMIENSSINLALPKILERFNTSSSNLEWVVDAYTMAFAGFMLAAGYLGDRLGRKKVLIVGLIGFGIVSVFASRANSITTLIAAQASIGLFAALVFPTTLASISSMFDERPFKQIAISIWTATAGLSVAIGPTCAGWFLENYDWSSVYWINIILAPLALFSVIFFVPGTRGETLGKFDFPGFILSILSITALIWSIIQAPVYGWLSQRILIGDALSLVLIILFVIRELCCKHPLFDMTVFRYRNFSVSVIAVAISFFGLFGFMFSVSMIFQVVCGYGPFESGLRELPFALFMALWSPITVVIARSMRVSYVMSVGLFFLAEGFYLVRFVHIDSSFTIYLWIMFILAVGVSFIQVPATSMIMSALPARQAGAGSAVNDTTRELGGAIGVAVIGSMTNTDFARRATRTLSEFPIPDEIKNEAGKSVLNAVAIAQRVPQDVMAKVLHNIKSEYLLAISYSCWCAIIASIVGVFVCILFLRGATLSDSNGVGIEISETL